LVLGCGGLLLACGTSGSHRAQVPPAPPSSSTDFPADVDQPSSKRGVIVPSDIPVEGTSPTIAPTGPSSSPSGSRNPLGSP
jgi:hypothetical protein